MNFSTIQSAGQQPAQAPPSPKAAEVLASALQTARLKAHEYTKKSEVMEPAMPSTTVVHHSQNYCQSKGWARVAGVFEAMERRAKGERVISYREADIAARNNLLSQQVVIDQIMGPMEFFIMEDTAGVDCSVYELRRRWNYLLKDLKKGQEYKETKYDKQPQAQKDKCDAYIGKLEREMRDIKNHLFSIGLAMWPEEIEHGFHPNLCRPEYMTEDQYQEKLAKFDVQLHDWKDPNETN